MKMRKSFRTVKYRRERESKTDYRRRLKQLISRKPRLVVRKYSRSIIAQVVGYDAKGDKVLASANSQQLKKLGLKLNPGNVPSAYLSGYWLGLKAKKLGIGEIIADIGYHKSKQGAKIYAVIQGYKDSEAKINFSGDMAPSEERLKGKHIQDYLKKNPVGDVVKHYEEIKNKIKAD